MLEERTGNVTAVELSTAADVQDDIEVVLLPEGVDLGGGTIDKQSCCGRGEEDKG